VNAHAEELRSVFVKHEGKKALTITACGSRYTVDFGDLAKQMTGKIEKNVRELRGAQFHLRLRALRLTTGTGSRQRSKRLDLAKVFHHNLF
jgi:hypothetical protein